MEAEIEYWDRVSYYSTREEVKRTETWKDSEEGIFKRFYKNNNSLRYCNGSYYKLKSNALKKKYDEWYESLSESVTFKMYYGNGVVD